ncbi:MAG: hypothetical protein LBB88_04485 [Planctomycetaceae bacterium]|nr:hypothetical protein [Planctomycetaceae bacterium]
MILIIVESILSLPSATRPFGERSPTCSITAYLINKRLLTDKYCVT